MLTALLLLIAAKAAVGIAAAIGGRAAHRPAHLALALLGGASGVVAVASLVAGGPAPTLALPVGLPWLDANFRLDALGAWFLLIAALGGASAAVYGIGYARHLAEPGRVLPFLALFLAAVDLVLVADDAFVFLLAWEGMSLAAWLLVLANHREAGNADAARLFLIMAALGTLALLLCFGAFAGADGAYRFADMRAAPPRGWTLGFALALAILGAGSKAGLVPLHAWLPLAHPAAPSHVSALLSGVMTKVALYGLVRILFDLAGPLPWGWGAALMALGALSAIAGVLHALLERDLKTLLAWSTVENVGVIALALGLALVFRADGVGALAALALAAALLHAFNHAVMKSLMFFVAGAVQTATGTRDLERLGGLIHRMPATAAIALAGAAAIAALPPFAGFVSEWLAFQAVLNAPVLAQWPLKFAVPAAGAVLALSVALAAACFVRAYGIAFLGRPRSPEAASATEVEPAMRWTMAALAVLCLLAGIFPLALIALLDPVLRQLAGHPFMALADGFDPAGLIWLTPLEAGRSSYSGLIVALVVVLVVWAVVESVHRLATARLRRGPAWDCGFPDPSPATQYTASSFAQPLRRVFGAVAFRARESVDMPEPGETRAARFAVATTDLAWAVFYAPVGRGVAWLADRCNVLQYLSIRRYLVLMFSALITLLIATALAR